ncbi:cytochrome P450 94A1-like [Tripterygium wilfordii]|uniref:Cytochrome P450 94A1-like n=1 Tax=Tripterygium wilfordii TaxID=458696 RepID=A0A7J7DNJ2_TRIWF|nr:cytochrome P450 94A1-like [Tripterygium wilfordii]
MEVLFYFLALPFLFLLSLYLINTSKHKPKTKTKTGFKTYPILGVLPDFLKNKFRFLDWTTEILINAPNNTAVLYRPSRIHSIITANPDVVEYILKTNFENYPKGENQFIIFLKDFLGRGIFNSNGDLWKFQRKTSLHEFNTKSLRKFCVENAGIEISTRLIPMIAKAGETGQVLDLQDMLERFAFDSICKLAFNVDPCCLGGDGNAGSDFMRAFEKASRLSSGRFLYPLPILWTLKKFFNLGSEKSLRNSIKIVYDFADKIIRSRLEKQNEKKKDEDLLSRFIVDTENSPEFLRYVVISFILAGRDTISSVLTWFFWLLASNKEAEEKILNELEMIRKKYRKNVGDTYTYSFDAIRDMHYLHAAISESMRLYPPVAVNTKACLNADIQPGGLSGVPSGQVVGERDVSAGEFVSVSDISCRSENMFGERFGLCSDEGDCVFDHWEV